MRTWRVSISSYCKPKKWARFIAVSATPVKNRAAKVDTTKLARWKHERKGWRWHRYQRRSFFTKAHIVWTAEGQRPSCIGNVSLLRIVSNLWGYCMLTKQKKKAPLSSTIYIYIYMLQYTHVKACQKAFGHMVFGSSQRRQTVTASKLRCECDTFVKYQAYEWHSNRIEVVFTTNCLDI